MSRPCRSCAPASSFRTATDKAGRKAIDNMLPDEETNTCGSWHSPARAHFGHRRRRGPARFINGLRPMRAARGGSWRALEIPRFRRRWRSMALVSLAVARSCKCCNAQEEDQITPSPCGLRRHDGPRNKRMESDQRTGAVFARTRSHRYSRNSIDLCRLGIDASVARLRPDARKSNLMQPPRQPSFT